MKPAASSRSLFALPQDIPWQQSVGLLLDAVQVTDLLKRLYQWADMPTVKVLYFGTRLAQLKTLSPCLVRINSAEDPVLAQFLRNLDQKWGYLLVSDAPWEQTAAHMQWLVSVEHPSGQEMLLRIASPEVADALFGSAETVLFGPCHRVMTADLVNGGWRQYHRPGEMTQDSHAKPYRLSDKQWLSLELARTRKTVSELSVHMAQYFPEYYADVTDAERNQHLHALVHRAAEHGFDSEKELYLYCNAHGFLGQHGLEDSSLALLLTPHPSDEDSTWRAQQLARLAHERSRP